MTCGSFEKQQTIYAQEVDKNKPLLNGFKDKGINKFTSHTSIRTHIFDYKYKPILYIKADDLEGLD